MVLKQFRTTCRVADFFLSCTSLAWPPSWEFTHLLIAQIKWATVSDSLRSLRTNEQLWANHSGRSFQKSDCERIAQVSYDKWATISNSLRSLMINEQIACLFWLNRSFTLALTKNEPLAQKKLTKIIFFVTFFEHLKQNKWFAHSLFFIEWCEWIAQVAHQKWANHSFFWVNCSSAHFSQKTSNSLRKPMSKFPTLPKGQVYC